MVFPDDFRRFLRATLRFLFIGIPILPLSEDYVNVRRFLQKSEAHPF